MSANYFSHDDFSVLTSSPAQDMQSVYDKFVELHKALHRRMRDHNWDLHPNWDQNGMFVGRSAACSNNFVGLSLPYLRSREQAQLVERLMGRENSGMPQHVDVHRHPVVELRLTPEHFAVELVLSPTAWWDQRNLIGKLSVNRHREAFRALLQRMDGEYHFGFWDGIHLSDVHLTNRQLLRGSILEEWMSTFSDGQDWLRVGVWYEPENPSLSTSAIFSELTGRIAALYGLHTFMLWTSNNNFHSFYKGHIPLSGGKDTRL
jgi:hypothetical protein